MLKITAEQKKSSMVSITPASIKREWMDVTPEKHAYRCFPVTQSNVIGWNVSCNKDIVFLWNGINDTSSDNIKIIEGSDFTYTGRGQSTVSIQTGIVFRTKPNLSLMVINPVNYFNDDFETMSSLISTSWYDNDYPIAIKAKIPNKEITVKAGQPVATIVPISLTDLDNTSIEVYDYIDESGLRDMANFSYGAESQKVSQSGQWTDWYRNATNEKGESLGQHETKALRLFVKDNRVK